MAPQVFGMSIVPIVFIVPINPPIIALSHDGLSESSDFIDFFLPASDSRLSKITAKKLQDLGRQMHTTRISPAYYSHINHVHG